MGIGGLLGGLGQVSIPIQNGQLQGQIQGKETALNYDIQRANLMREAEAQRSKSGLEAAQSEYFTKRLPAMEDVAATRAQAERDVAGVRAQSAQEIARQTDDIKRQYNEILQKQNEAKDALTKQFYDIKGEQLRMQLQNVQRAQGMSQLSHFLDTSKDEIGSLKAYEGAAAALQQARAQNPAAVRGLLASLAQNEAGGGAPRASVMNYLTRINSGIVPNAQQAASMLLSNKLPDSDVNNIANLIEAEHQTHRSAYAQRFQQLQGSMQQLAPDALPMLAPYSPGSMFDVAGSTAGATGAQMGTGITPPTAPVNPYRTAPQAGVTQPQVAPPKMPLAAGASSTPNYGGN